MALKKYLNTVSAYQFYQFVRYGTMMLTGIILAKTGMSQNTIGQFETFILISGLVSFFWLNGLLKAFLPLSGNNERGKFFSTFVLIQGLSILAAVAWYFSGPALRFLLPGNNILPEPGLLFLFIAIATPANIVEYHYLLIRKQKGLIVYAVVSHLVQLVLVITPAFLGYSISEVYTGLVASALFRYIWLWVLMIKNKDLLLNVKFISENLRLGLPLVAATLLSGSADYIDPLIVTSKFDEASFAIFRYGARELPLAVLLANSLNIAMLPVFGNSLIVENLKILKAEVNKLIKLLFPVTIVLILISHAAYPLLFTPEFSKSASLFNIYMLLIISRVMMPQTILNGLKYTKEIMLASFFEIIINITLSLVLIQFFGLAGVAIGTFIAYFFEKIFLVIALKRKTGILLTEYLPVKLWATYSFLAIIVFIVTETLLK